MQSIGGSGIQLEFPPIGCPPVPNGGCLATSFGAMKRCQVIDLLAEGVNEYILDEVKIPIYVCEWFNSRYDCGVKYFMKVALMDCKRNKIPGFKISFNGEKGDDQNEWDKFEYTFRDYPSGVRYIQFKDYGKDTKYWEGFYGAKLAGATVRFLLESM
ncbi:F-box only protein 17-like isoform X2 [Xenia sp. Carnegie-2017]|uniref:F-box only protein 17-like isoform X2 n=1 Tax=Xenia sp. Carnegie-2017 TaxID=2897299 RepID=UPI001F03ACD7|nr:F-box only protein 17-like isoform X2 [Xenia sp. Carnegie-2017]